MKLRDTWAVLGAFLLFFAVPSSFSEGPKPRLTAAIDNASRVQMAQAHPELAGKSVHLGTDEGALPTGASLQGITLVFSRSAAQQADLSTLLAAQQDPASKLYHQWLTPDQFAARFGVADTDLAKAQTWLQSQGFQVNAIPRSRDRISFSGNAGQIAAAFGTELHRYRSSQGTHFAPAGDLSLPSALAPMVAGVLRLSDLHAHRLTHLQRAAAQPAYTSNLQPGSHFLTPSDVATMYDLSSTYKAGFNGAGQSIAIIGQSYIDTAPISAFQNGAQLAANLPTLVLVPNTGVNGVNAIEDGDEGESQLDLEYASGMAPGANMFFVYTGDAQNAGVFDSLSYAIAEDIAPVISGSYGVCEPELQAGGASALQTANVLNQEVQQANAQGQTVLFSSGDTGSTDCFGYTDQSSAVQEALSVDFPASIPNITAVGGTEMASGTYTAGSSQYWQSTSGSDVISSLLSYVPETVWNEDNVQNTTQPLSSGGGGSSILFPRPSWQAGVPGIPAGANRLLPDLSLQASVESPGFIYCTSDPSDLAYDGLDASCTNGLRSANSTFLIAGGTSFATPIMAGLLAVLNQVTHAKGQGNLNTTLYALAANPTSYALAFHDITSGTNGCAAGPTYCSAAGTASFSATTGYDEATGLGSIDFLKLSSVWPATAASVLASTTTTLAAATSTPAAGATDQVNITVAPQAGAAGTPTGTVQVSVNGTAVGTALPLSNGTATYLVTAPTTSGSYAVTATYSGDGTYAASTGTTVITIGNATPAGSFTLAAQSITVATNSTGTAIVTLTPASGYTGTVSLALTYPSNAPTLCYSLSNQLTSGFNVPLVNNGQPVPVTLTIGEGTVCGTSASAASVSGRSGVLQALGHQQAPGRPRKSWPEGVVFAGLFGAGLLMRRSRRLPVLLALFTLAAVSFTVTGCGGSSQPTTVIAQPKTFTLTLTGTDSVNSSISNSTSLTLTVQ